MRTATLFSFLFYSAILNGAGRDVKQQQQIWYDFTPTIKINPKWSVVINLGERHNIVPFAQSQALARAYFLYHFNSGWSMGTGFVNFWLWEGDLYFPEYRPEQWFFYRQQFDKAKFLALTHRFKIEERFMHNTAGAKLASGYTFTMRFRYQFGAELELFKTGKNRNPFKFLISDEVMINAGKSIVYNVFDQNRLTAGFSYRPLPGMTLMLTYMNLFRQKKSGDNFDEIHTLRIGIQQEIFIRQKEKNKP